MRQRPRRQWHGVAVCAGVGIGPLRWVAPQAIVPAPRPIAAGAVRAEVARLRRAITDSRATLQQARAHLPKTQHEPRLLLDAHLLMHDDVLWVQRAVELIEKEQVNAEWALRCSMDIIQRALRAAEHPAVGDRARDVEQVGQQILRVLQGNGMPRWHIDAPCVLWADDLSPAQAVDLLRRPLHALVTMQGGSNGHTAVLARALGVPAVVGVRAGIPELSEGDPVIVDGFAGTVTLRPTAEECATAAARSQRYQSFQARLRQPTMGQGELPIHANIEVPEEIAVAQRSDAAGIGLFRTEFLFLDRRHLPSEQEQYRHYAEVVRAMAPRPVVFRTFDLGGDKLPGPRPTTRSRNPALGLRALRLSLRSPELLQPQLRAILRSSHLGPVQLLLPLVSTVDELVEARGWIARCRTALIAEGHALG
ncbi:MAG: putative PEP-binding protein, partial [Polyangiales bacterium]